jgi:hypothetical protein
MVTVISTMLSLVTTPFLQWWNCNAVVVAELQKALAQERAIKCTAIDVAERLRVELSDLRRRADVGRENMAVAAAANAEAQAMIAAANECSAKQKQEILVLTKSLRHEVAWRDALINRLSQDLGMWQDRTKRANDLLDLIRKAMIQGSYQC